MREAGRREGRREVTIDAIAEPDEDPAARPAAGSEGDGERVSAARRVRSSRLATSTARPTRSSARERRVPATPVLRRKSP